MVRCLKMNDKLLIDAFKGGNSQPLHAEIKCVILIFYSYLSHFITSFSFFMCNCLFRFCSVDEYATEASGSSNYANYNKNFSSLIKGLETGHFFKAEW